MRLLLDTHIWLWNDLEPLKITPGVHRELADFANEIWLSPVSIWELTLLVQKRRIHLKQDLQSWIEESIEDLQLQEAAFTWEVARDLRLAQLRHGDPGDQFLVATAKAYDLTLVTADEELLNVPGLKVLANR